jgi:biotin transport system permease protein
VSAFAVYLPGDSVLHRAPAGAKLVALALVAMVSVVIRQPWQVAVLLVAVAALYAVARVPWRTALTQVSPLAWFAVGLAVFQLVVSGWERAVVVVGGLLGLLVALAVRAVPVVTDLARQVREAQLARGAAAGPRAFVVPLVVRSLRHADRLADALVARGLDD